MHDAEQLKSKQRRRSSFEACSRRTTVAARAPSHTNIAVRLAAALGTSERFWLGLQADYDLEEARRALGGGIARIQRVAA